MNESKAVVGRKSCGVLAAARTVGMLAVLASAVAFSGCASVKPVVRTVVNVAHDLCAMVMSERQGITVEDAARFFCTTEKQLEPWIEELLAAERRAAERVKAGQQ